jgi:PAS domain S-box-containing protein
MNRNKLGVRIPERLVQWSGVVLTVGIVILLELFRRTGIQLVDSPIVLIVGIALTATVGGRIPGWVSIVLASAYWFWVFADRTPERFILWTLIGIGCLLLIDRLKRRDESATIRVRLQEIVDGSPDLIALLDLKGRGLYMNKAGRSMVGLGETEAIDRLTIDQYHPDWAARDVRERYLPIALREGVWIGETTMRRRDGTEYPVAQVILAHQVPDGTIQHISTIARDISVRRRAEQALRTNEDRYVALLAEASHQTQEMHLLDRVRTAISREFKLSIIMHTVVEAVAESYGYTHVSIYMLQGDMAILQHQVGYDQVIPRLPIDNTGVSGRVLRTGQPILLEDVHTDPYFLGAVEGLSSEVCVPLFDEERVVGLFNIESSNDVHLTVNDLRIAVALSELIGIAIGRARLYTETLASESRYRAIVEDQTELICRGLPDGKINFVNGAFSRYLGCPPETLIGQNFVNTLPESISKRYADHVAKLNHEAPTFTMEYSLQRPDGTTVWQNWTVRGIFGEGVEADRVVELQAVGRDITEQKRAETHLLELVIEREKVKTLQSFIQNTSHNLNTPISVLRTAGYLSRKFADQVVQQTRALAEQSERVTNPAIFDRTQIAALQESAAQVQQQMVVQDQNTKKLQKIVTGLLRLAELDRNPELTLTVRSVNMLVETALDAMRPMASVKKISLTGALDPGAPRAALDEWEFNQAIQQLIENAIAYTPEGGVITVRTTHDDHEMRLIVEDNGIGIAEMDLTHIFERFYRVEALQNDTTGKVGLGLSIVQKIIEAHHGRIEVTSTLGKGSTFQAILPRA